MLVFHAGAPRFIYSVIEGMMAQSYRGGGRRIRTSWPSSVTQWARGLADLGYVRWKDMGRTCQLGLYNKMMTCVESDTSF